MQTIRLERAEWRFDESKRLGPKGGFGEVFLGLGEQGEVAVKRLLLSAGAAAYREMQIGEALANQAQSHIVPVLDYGLDANSDTYFLVMPVCQRSLQDEIQTRGKLPWADAKPAILGIMDGLQEFQGIVHRDLKPGNILLLDDQWKVADFGIAKFVEDATSLNTLRDSLTPSYAAPEQWRGERPTSATDIYALACIIYALLSGNPPYVGSLDDVRQQHLFGTPPAIEGIDARLGGLLNVMLRKPQAARPSLDRCKALIAATEVALPTGSSRASLAAAGEAVARAAATAEAERLAEQEATREWQAIGEEGSRELDLLLGKLARAVTADAPNAEMGSREISLGPAKLTWDATKLLDRRVERRPGYPTEGIWQVAAYSRMSLRCRVNRQVYHDPSDYTFRTTLAFARTPSDANFRWREIAFYKQFSGDMQAEPTALTPEKDEFYVALSPVIGSLAIAFGPQPVDVENESEFIERWIHLFAKAAHGNLRPPQQLPLSPAFFR